MNGWARVLGSALAIGGITLGIIWLAATAPAPLTAAGYLDRHPQATLAGTDFRIGNYPLRCGKAELILDPAIDDLAHSYPGLIVMNGKYLPRLPPVVGLYAFGHECGHVLHGPDENTADCYSVMRGQAQGWLDAEGVNRICDFWRPFAGTSTHLPGEQRCALMRRCFAAASAAP